MLTNESLPLVLEPAVPLVQHVLLHGVSRLEALPLLAAPQAHVPLPHLITILFFVGGSLEDIGTPNNVFKKMSSSLFFSTSLQRLLNTTQHGSENKLCTGTILASILVPKVGELNPRKKKPN